MKEQYDRVYELRSRDPSNYLKIGDEFKFGDDLVGIEVVYHEDLGDVHYSYITTIIAYDAFTGFYELEVPVHCTFNGGEIGTIYQIVHEDIAYVRKHLVAQLRPRA